MDSHSSLRRGAAALAACAALLAAAPAQAKTPLGVAEEKALDALGVESGSAPVLVLRQRTPLRPGTVVRQAGPSRPAGGKATKRGVRRARSRVALRVPHGEGAWLFYADEAPFQAYQHPGRVVLVGVESREAVVSRRLQWPPVIGGKLPRFMRSAEAYRDPANRIFYRFWDAKDAGARSGRANGIANDQFGAAAQSIETLGLRQRAADRLAEEGSCVVRFGETLGRFYAFSAVSETVVGFGGLFNGLERLNAGFKSDRYGVRSGRSPLAYVQRLIDGGCRDVLLYLAGSGYKGRNVVNFGLGPRRDGTVDVQEVSATQLRSFTRRNAGVTFKVIADAPYSGGFATLVDAEPNVLIAQAPGLAHEPSFRFIPGILRDGEVLRNLGNPAGLLEFTNRLRIGFERFLASESEIDHAEGQTAAARPRRFLAQGDPGSFLVWSLGRAFELSEDGDFAGELGLTNAVNHIKDEHKPTTPPGGGANPPAVNHPPVADAQTLSAVEDTARAVTLSGSDPDGDPVGYEVLTQPEHGDLTGTAPSLTYTPDANFNGSDSFTFRVGDGALVSEPATVTLEVAAANDAPVAASSAGSTGFTENGAATPIDGGLALSDVDSASLAGAAVKIGSGFELGLDELAMPAQPGIAAAYDGSAGVLTLTGAASVADYQAALRAVTFRHTGDDPTATRRIDFVANDGGLASAAASKTVAIAPVNDLPVVDTTNTNLAYAEDDPPLAIDPALTVADPDDDQISGAVVEISAGHLATEDELAFVDAGAITGSYDGASGTLTLSGTASKAAYQAALRTVTYENSSQNPSTAARTVGFRVTDASGGMSAAATRDVDVTAAQDLAEVTTSAGSTSYTEGDPGTVIDGGLTVTDHDDANLEGAFVRIVGFESGDDLTFVNTANISGTYNTGTGELTLSGTDTVANYQAALRSITFDNTVDDNLTSPKTIEFKADDGNGLGAASSKGIAVTGVNDKPVVAATGSALSYTEGDGAVAVDGALGVSDPDSANLAGATVAISGAAAGDELVFVDTANITGSYNGVTDVLTLSGADTVAAYQAALRSVAFRNGSDSPSTATRTVGFTVDDGAAAQNVSDVASRDVSVAAVNDAPVVTASAGSTAYTEGGAAKVVDGGVTVTDAEDTNLEGAQVRVSSGFQSGDDLVFVNQNGISGVYNTGTGVLTMSGTSSVANYQTALRSVEFQSTNDAPVGSKTVEFKANDGDVDSNLATKGIAVTAVNDAPTVNTSGGSASFVEDTSGPVAVDPNVAVSDPDSAQLSGATVSITAGHDPGEDQLVFVDQNGIAGVYNSGTGVLTLSGDATVANYQAALRSVAYDNSDTVGPSTATRTVTFTATDTSSATSGGATRDVTVASVNDAPVVATSAGSTGYVEDDPSVAVDGGVTVTDADDSNLEGAQVRVSSGFQSGDDLVFVNQNGISGVYNTGTGVLTMSGTSSVANYETALRSVRFRSTNQQPVTSKTVEFKANDGDVDSNLATKEIAVTPTNDGPVVNATDASLTFTEDDPATAVDSALTVTENEGDSLSGGSASITAGYQAGQDDLSWADNNLADNITLDGVNTTDQTIVLTGVDSAASYQAALRAVTFLNTSQSPAAGNRSVTFSATDVPGASLSDARTVTVVNVDDPPTGVNDSATVLEDAAATSVAVLTNDTDPDGGQKTISSAGDPANGTVVLTGGSPGAHTGLTYQPDPNYCNDPPGTSPDTFIYTLNGGSTALVSMTVTCVNDAPVADDETFSGNDSAHGNTTLQVDDPDDNKSAPTSPHTEITGDILAGDTDIDGPGPMQVTPGTFATNDGGAVTLESDGDFVFQPAASTSCTDTSDFFDYTVEDSGSPEQTDTGRVTIQIAGCVWYVSNNAAGNSGTSQAPFDTLAQAETASGANHTVFVYDGDNTSTGYQTGFAMNSGERLIGEHEGLTVDPDQGGSLTADTLHPANAGAHPTISGTNEDVVALDDGNELRGFNVEPAGTGGGIAGASGDTGGATIDDVNVIDTGVAAQQPLFELDSTTGTFNVSNLVVNNQAASSPPNTATGVRLNSAGTVIFSSASQISIGINGAKGLDAASTNLRDSTFDDITVAGSSAGGVNLSSTSGNAGDTLNLGDGTGSDLSLTTTSGSDAALRVSNHTVSALRVLAAGTDDLHATGGPAVDVTGTSGPTLELDDVDSTNSVNDGINLDGLGTGTFSASSGDIAGADGISFDLNGGSGAITYPGAFGNHDGTTAIDITGRSGGVISLSGNISDTNDTGGGVNLGSNTGGSTVLSGATKQSNTGTADAVLFNSSDGHTFVLSGGGTDIDTTTGKGLEAATSGTIEVSGSGNTIDTTTGRGLNVSDTDIASADLTLQRVSSNGALNGIRLNNTANAGGALTVTGSGGTCTLADTSGCSGGAILNSTGAGVELTSVPGGVSLTRNRIANGGDDGIRATTVGSSAANGIALQNSVISNNGNAVGEHGLDYDNVLGISSINNSVATGNAEFNARVDNDTGTGRLTVDTSTFSSNSSTVGADGLLLNGDGTATMRALVQNSTFQANRDDGFQLLANADGNVDLTFSNNTVNASGNAGAVSAHAGVTLTSNTTSDVKVNYANGTISGADGSALIINPIGSGSTFDATVNNVTIGTAGVAGSGSATGQGIRAIPAQNTDAEILITNSDVSGTGQNGMLLRHNDGGGSTDFTVTGNVIRNVGSGNEPIFVQSGSLNTDTTTVCADIGGAGGDNAPPGNDFAGQGSGGVTDIAFRRPSAATGAHLVLPGFDGNPANLTSYIQSRNVGSPSVVNFSGALEAGGAACQQPASPTLP